MRKQIAAANWKMNLTFQEAETLLNAIVSQVSDLNDYRNVVFGVPAPYLKMAADTIANKANINIAAQMFTQKNRVPIQVKLQLLC
jgi:triosephosphate isomerase